MTSKLHLSFRRDFRRLPAQIQKRAHDAYRKFSLDPFHRSLHFKRLSIEHPLWSVRITDTYRAVGLRRDPEVIVWFFIGTHTEYDALIARS